MEKVIIPTCIKENLERRKSLVKKKNGDEILEKTDEESVKNAPRLSDNLIEISDPYPEISDAFPSPSEVKLIKRQNSSKSGEFTEISNYVFQHIVLASDYPEISNILLEISLAEMKHFELLSEAIVDFGGVPNLTDGMGNVWSGRYLNQTQKIKEILLDDIKGEELAIKNYTSASMKTKNESLSQLFLRIAEDEKLHLDTLKKILQSL